MLYIYKGKHYYNNIYVIVRNLREEERTNIDGGKEH
jgi:hypothetical protein